MPQDFWYRVVTPRAEVRAGRSFNPDEFAIHLEQVVAGTAPDDYRLPEKFFARTYFTRALREHAAMVLRRLTGETTNSAPVLTLVTQFGGGKTHTLAALYHLARAGNAARDFPGVADVLRHAGIDTVPRAAVGVFVGSAWDPRPGRETPWIDLACQVAEAAGLTESAALEALGPSARTAPPGTEALTRLFATAGGTVLILMDEVLNFVNRHRDMAEHFYAFIQNLTIAMTGTTRGAAVISLPRSQVEMTDWDVQWQERITRVVRRVSKDLIANDETEISEVIRRRLFEDLGNERTRRRVAKEFADWCFERRAQLPAEWTAVDSASTEANARQLLQRRFEASYPFHPATLTVFQRKWQALPQYQQTRGTLAMLAQWVSWVFKEAHSEARREALLTLGSAPLHVPAFRAVVLGQIGESRLEAAINADLAGEQSHARSLDTDTSGHLKDIHRRVGTAMFFESSGGQTERVAHLPELRFAILEPGLDTTSIDSAALALESHAYFIRRVGADGFRIGYRPTLRKVVSDRRASLDEAEIRDTMERLVREEFERGRAISTVWFPPDGAAIQDSPKLTLVVMAPANEWLGHGGLRAQIAEWTRQRGQSPRLYPASLVWCIKKPGRELQEKTEIWLAWKRVQKDVAEGLLGDDFDRADRTDLHATIKGAEDAAREEVWASYRYIALADHHDPTGLAEIDLGAGHSSASDTLSGRVIATLKSRALLNDSVGASYIERNWPPALRESGAWPLTSLRQSFLDGSLTRLIDPDSTLRGKIVEFVMHGDLGLASGQRADGTFERVWFEEPLPPDEATFEPGLFLLRKERAQALRAGVGTATTTAPVPHANTLGDAAEDFVGGPATAAGTTPDHAAMPARTFRLSGTVPPETWNRLGIKLIPKLRVGDDLRIEIELSVSVSAHQAAALRGEIPLVLQELGIAGSVRIEER